MLRCFLLTFVVFLPHGPVVTDTAESQVPGSDGNIRPPLPILAKPTYDRIP